jgi:hypothetical protein
MKTPSIKSPLRFSKDKNGMVYRTATFNVNEFDVQDFVFSLNVALSRVFKMNGGISWVWNPDNKSEGYAVVLRLSKKNLRNKWYSELVDSHYNEGGEKYID